MILVTKGDTVLFFALLRTIIGLSKPAGHIYLYPVPGDLVLYGWLIWQCLCSVATDLQRSFIFDFHLGN